MKLYIAHVGFYDLDVGIYELHTNYLVVAKNELEAKEKVQSKDIFIAKGMHIDALQEIVSVDGYEVVVSGHEKQHQNKAFDYTAVKNLA